MKTVVEYKNMEMVKSSTSSPGYPRQRQLLMAKTWRRINVGGRIPTATNVIVGSHFARVQDDAYQNFLVTGTLAETQNGSGERPGRVLAFPVNLAFVQTRIQQSRFAHGSYRFTFQT